MLIIVSYSYLNVENIKCNVCFLNRFNTIKLNKKKKGKIFFHPFTFHPFIFGFISFLIRLHCFHLARAEWFCLLFSYWNNHFPLLIIRDDYINCSMLILMIIRHDSQPHKVYLPLYVIWMWIITEKGLVFIYSWNLITWLILIFKSQFNNTLLGSDEILINCRFNFYV